MNDATSSEPWIDPDNAPPLTAAWFDGADAGDGEKLIRRGRPPMDKPKKLVSLRLDLEVVERFRAIGRGWQTRANEALRKAVGL